MDRIPIYSYFITVEEGGGEARLGLNSYICPHGVGWGLFGLNSYIFPISKWSGEVAWFGQNYHPFFVFWNYIIFLTFSKQVLLLLLAQSVLSYHFHKKCENTFFLKSP